MPQDKEAEQAVLGSVLIDPEAVEQFQYLTPEHFYIVRHKWIYAVMLELRQAGQDVDILTVGKALDRAGKLEEAGGMPYLMALINKTPTSLHAESYARIVVEVARDRQMVEIATQIAQAGMTRQADKSAAISAAIEQLSRIHNGKTGAVHWSAWLSQVYDEVEEAIKTKPELIGIPTGLPDWNAITGGLVKKTTTLLSGDPGTGKTVLMMQVLVAAAREGHRAALYEFDVSAMQVTRREVSSRTDILTRSLRLGKLTEAEIPAFTHAIEELSRLGVYICEETGWTTQDLRVDLHRLKDAYGVELFGVDMIDDFADPAPDENTFDRLVNTRVHECAKDLDLAGLIIGKMTKSGISGAVKGQGGVGGTAKTLHTHDDIMILKLADPNDRNGPVNVTWDKLREPFGQGNYMQLLRKPGFPHFENLAQRQERKEKEAGRPIPRL
jgi:replicative DNA helicase